MASTSSESYFEQQITKVVRWNYPREQMQNDYYKVAATGKPKLIGKVKARLQTYNQQTVDAMAKTPFKYLMRYPDNITMSGRCMHHLISREAIGTPDPDPSAIFFRVNGQIVRFGRIEFAIVTQLRFGASSFDIYAQHDISIDSVYYRVFHGEAMSPDQLWKWYTRDSSFGRIEADDCVKISQVLIVAHIILGLSPTNSKIPDWVWVLVEDKRKWNKFPWGSLSYQILLKALKGVKHRMSAMNYQLFGNSLAFLGWIFCAFPDVGRDIGGCVNRNARPRGLRFTYANSGTYGEIDINEIFTHLEPDHRERNMSFLRYLEPEGTSFLLKYTAGAFERARLPMVVQEVVQQRRDRPESSRMQESRAATIQAAATAAGAGEGDENEVYVLTKKRKRKLVNLIATKAAKKAKVQFASMFEEFGDMLCRKLMEKLYPDRANAPSLVEGNEAESGHHSTVNDETVPDGDREEEEQEQADQDDGESHSGEGDNSDVEATEGEHQEKGENSEHEEEVDEAEGGDEEQQLEHVEQRKLHNEEDQDAEEEAQDEEDSEWNQHEEGNIDGDTATVDMADEQRGDREAENQLDASGDSEKEEEAEDDNDMQDEDLGGRRHQLVDEVCNADTQPSPQQMRAELDELRHLRKEILETNTDNSQSNPSTPQVTAKPGPSITSPDEVPLMNEADKPIVTYTRIARNRKPVAILKSPFLANDVRGRDFQRYMKGKKELRNVGLPYGVDQEYFADIKNMKAKLENEHIDPYISILATNPRIANIRNVKARTRIMGSMFMRSIEEVWMKLERPGDIPFDTEEIVPEEDLKSLAKWVTGEMPQWGKIESWEEADEIIMVCYFNEHWVTCMLVLVQFTLEIWDSNQHKFTDHIIDLRAKAFLPVARIIPQVLKYVCFYDSRPDMEPVYSQWLHYHPDVNVIRQDDSESCGPLALKYAENRLRGVGDSPMSSAAVQRYRNHIAECIYKFITDESTIDTSG